MITETPLYDTLIVWLTNTFASTVCSQIHKSLYFLLGLTFWAMHFGHYFLTFILLNALNCFGVCVFQPRLPVGQLWPLVVTESIVSLATCLVHTGGSDGTVHVVRLTDFAVTLLVIFLSKYFVDESFYSPARSTYTSLVALIAICSSAAWMEPIIAIDYKTYIAWPLIAVCTGLHFMFAFQLAQKSKVSPITLTWQISGFTSLILFLPAVYFTSDSFNEDSSNVQNSVEPVEWVLVALSCCFVFAMLISKYMLLCGLTPESYAVSRHSKYLLASFGQWLLQNMAYVTLISVLGKISAFILICVYCFKRWVQRQNGNVILSDVENKRMVFSGPIVVDGSTTVTAEKSLDNGQNYVDGVLTAHRSVGYL